MKALKAIQTEVDAAFLYARLADVEKDEKVAGIFRKMCEIETSHARAFLANHQLPESAMPQPSAQARILNRIGRWFGYDYVLGVLMETEKSLAYAVTEQKKKSAQTISGGENNHVRILQQLVRMPGMEAGTIARFESRHRSVGGNALRAAVLGGNDGLVSNFSLVMGVAGATAGGQEVLLAGMAGLLAGALSMALGEWISVKSSQELYENQMALEQEELENSPETEQLEIELIYRAKGIPEEQARSMAAELIREPQKAHAILVKEELGIQAEELKGSAFEAALYSFFLFAIGAILPVFPFFFLSGITAIVVSATASAAGLFVIGASITLFTGKNWVRSGLRQVLFGLAAAAITFGIGKLLGASIS